MSLARALTAAPRGAAWQPSRARGRGPRRRCDGRRRDAAARRGRRSRSAARSGRGRPPGAGGSSPRGRRRAGSAASRPGRRRPRAWGGRSRRGRCGVGFFTHTRRPARRRTTSSSGTSISSAAVSWRSRRPSASSSALACCLVSREAVEQEPVAGVLGVDALDDHPDDHLVGDELAGVHEALRLAPELGVLGDVGAQHVAGRDVRQVEVFRQPLRLGALARTRGTQQDQVQVRHDHGQTTRSARGGPARRCKTAPAGAGRHPSGPRTTSRSPRNFASSAAPRAASSFPARPR